MSEKELKEVVSKLRDLGQECHNIDAKQQLCLLEIGDKAELVKDIIAMANNAEMSYIVIGLQDSSFDDIGKLLYNHTKSTINQIISDKIDPPISVEYEEYKIDENEYGLIKVIGINPPYIVARDLISNKTDKKKNRIYKGMIYIRHQDITRGVSRIELEILLNKGLRSHFQNVPEIIHKILMEKPDRWEYLLTAKLWQHNYSNIERNLIDLKNNLVYFRSKQMNLVEFTKWGMERASDLEKFIGKFKHVIQTDIMQAWGKPGEPGDPIKIKQSIDRLISVCENLINWEAEINSIIIPYPYEYLKPLMQGWTLNLFDGLNKLFYEIDEFATKGPREGQHILNLDITLPEKAAQFAKELNRLERQLKGQ